MRKRTSFLLLAAGLASVLSAQGTFNLLTGRLHRGLSWDLYETEHFRVVYNRGLEEVARRAGTMAEQIYRVHRQNLGLGFARKQHLFITDADDIANGATSPYGYFFIWTRASDWLEHFTGRDPWLPSVIAHEMVHALIFENTRGILDRFLPLSAVNILLYRDFYEGMAQFYGGEEWGLMRGEKYLSLAFRTVDLESDETDLENGPLTYAKGFSQVKWLRQKQSDRQLGAIFAPRNRLGPFRFGKAFKRATGQSYDAFLLQWLKEMNIYNSWKAAMAEAGDEIGREVVLPGCLFVGSVKASPDGRSYAYSGIESESSPGRLLCLKAKEGGQHRVLARNGIQPNFSWSGDGSLIAFCRRCFDRRDASGTDLFTAEVSTGRERRLTRDGSSREPVFVSGERILFASSEGHRQGLYLCRTDGSSRERLVELDDQTYVMDLGASSDGGRVAASYLDAKKREYGIMILQLDDRSLRRIPTPALYRCPLFSPEGKNILLCTSYEGGTANALRLDLENGKREWVSNQADYLLLTHWPSPAEALGVRQGERRGNSAFALDPSRTPPTFAGTLQPRFRNWLETEPAHSPLKLDASEAVPGEYKGKFRPLSTFHLLSLVPLPVPFVGSGWSPGLLALAADMPGKTLLGGGVAVNTADPSHSSAFFDLDQALPPFRLRAAAGYQGASTFHYPGDYEAREQVGFAAIGLSIPLAHSFLPQRHLFSLTCRFEESRPLDAEPWPPADVGEEVSFIEAPLPFRQASITLGWRFHSLRTASQFPRRGIGFGAEVGAHHSLKEDGLSFQRFHLGAAALIPLGDELHLFWSAGLGGIEGQAAPQQRLGAARYLPFSDYLNFSEEVYVRGGTLYHPGNRLATATVELRQPLPYPLHNAIALFFLDGAAIWQDPLPAGEKPAWVGSLGVELQMLLADKQTVLALGTARSLAEGEGWRTYLQIKSPFPF